MANLILGS